MAESDASQDLQTELKKRARRRLVGAAALALLAAIVLPMVMDHEPRPPSQEIQVRIPSQDGSGFASRVMPAKSGTTPLPAADKGVADSAKSEVKAAAKPVETVKSAPQDGPAQPAPEAAAASSVSAEKPAATVKAEAKPNDKPVKSAEKPAEKPTVKPAEKKPVDKKLEDKKPEDKKVDEKKAQAALAGGDQWLVLLGAYKDAGNVKLLTGKLKQMGLPSFTEHFDSPQGPRTRVRAGPFPSKEAADKALARVRTMGVDGQVAQKP
jgi:DedD protein